VLTPNQVLWIKFQVFTGSPIHPPPLGALKHNREWKILSHNIRGINGTEKWISLCNKIKESSCDIICLQETEREYFDKAYLRKFCPRQYDKFHFHPSIVCSGGTIVIWHGTRFSGEMVFENEYAQIVKFHSHLTNESRKLTSIYAPYTTSGKMAFLQWFSNHPLPQDMPFIILGEFNLICRPENRASFHLD
jgi:exonuclease III